MNTITFRKRAGQNTIEYLLMLAVIVTMVLIAGIALKKYMPNLVGQITDKISNSVNVFGSGAGNTN
jgi:Flp pilus assembly pilin Flp